MSELLNTKLSSLASKDYLVNLTQQVTDLKEESETQREEIRNIEVQNKYILD